MTADYYTNLINIYRLIVIKQKLVFLYSLTIFKNLSFSSLYLFFFFYGLLDGSVVGGGASIYACIMMMLYDRSYVSKFINKITAANI